MPDFIMGPHHDTIWLPEEAETEESRSAMLPLQAEALGLLEKDFPERIPPPDQKES